MSKDREMVDAFC